MIGFESGMAAIEPALVSQQRPHHTSNLNNAGDGKKDEILEMSHTIPLSFAGEMPVRSRAPGVGEQRREQAI